MSEKYELIMTIVHKGYAEVVVSASRKAGAGGGTVMNGRGQGIHEKAKLFGIRIEPEKDIVLTLSESDKTEMIIDAISDAVKLDEPGNGIAFVLPVLKTAGICHDIKGYIEEDEK